MFKIAIIGQQCAGKTTAAQMIKTYLNVEVDLHKFADPLYEILDVLGVPKHRSFMQRLSDLVKEEYNDQEIFIKIFDRNIQPALGQDYQHDMVVDDCRYQAEFAYLKNTGWTTIFIDASESIRKARADVLGLEFLPNHRSEWEVPNFAQYCNYTVNNTSVYKVELQEKLYDIMQKLHEV